jgi:hypothetical protein
VYSVPPTEASMFVSAPNPPASVGSESRLLVLNRTYSVRGRMAAVDDHEPVVGGADQERSGVVRVMRDRRVNDDGRDRRPVVEVDAADLELARRPVDAREVAVVVVVDAVWSLRLRPAPERRRGNLPGPRDDRRD